MELHPDRQAIVASVQELVQAGLREKDFSLSKLVPSCAKVVIPHDHNTVELLYSRGIDVDGPIKFHYDFTWHKRLPAMRHQTTTADFITKMHRGFIFNDIGSGKTLSTLWAADYLQQLGVVNRVVIVCTLSTTWMVWADTLFKSFPERSFEVLTGTKQSRLRKLSRDADYYIVNHHGLKVLCEWETKNDATRLVSSVFDSRPDIDMVIVDECAVFRNARTDLYRSLDRISGENSGRRLWMISGDPMPNSPMDIWAQARLVKRDLLPQSYVRFRSQIMLKLSQFKWVPKPNWEKQIYELIAHYCIRFRRDDCIDLPPVVNSPRSCEMSTAQRKAYKKMQEQCLVEIQEKRIKAANEGVKINKLLQIACGCVYDSDGDTHELDCKNKLEMLYEAVEESHKKIIVFTPFIHSIGMLAKALEKKRWSVGIINGQVSKTKRNDIFHAFQSRDLQIILAHPKAMAHGLDLTRSHTICWWSPIDDYEIYNQANGRITRPGQTCKQTIVQLICAPVEKAIYTRLDRKEKMQGMLMELLTEKV